MGIGTVGGRLCGGAATDIMSGYNLAGDIEPDDTSAEVAHAAGGGKTAEIAAFVEPLTQLYSGVGVHRLCVTCRQPWSWV
jgi:hypothetical protein